MAGWLPVRMADDGTGVVDWAYLQGVPFVDPFFDQTVERAFRNPFRLLVRQRSHIDDVEELAGARARDPDGLILHVSRCGSTMLASALHAIAGVRVLSEPGPVHTVLTTTGDARVAALRLRRLLRAMAPDDPGTAHLVKLDAWTTLDLAIVRDAFPSVPWVLVHRDPAEVLVSLQRQRGFHAIPGALDPAAIGLTRAAAAAMGLDEYAATVIGRIMARGAEHARAAGDLALVLDHGELPHPGLDLATTHLRLTVTEADRDGMELVTAVHAKNPALPWAPDTEQKRAAITPELQRLADQAAGAAYERLRSMGASRASA